VSQTTRRNTNLNAYWMTAFCTRRKDWATKNLSTLSESYVQSRNTVILDLDPGLIQHTLMYSTVPITVIARSWTTRQCLCNSAPWRIVHTDHPDYTEPRSRETRLGTVEIDTSSRPPLASFVPYSSFQGGRRDHFLHNSTAMAYSDSWIGLLWDYPGGQMLQLQWNRRMQENQGRMWPQSSSPHRHTLCFHCRTSPLWPLSISAL